jgi:hypothetical protein
VASASCWRHAGRSFGGSIGGNLAIDRAGAGAGGGTGNAIGNGDASQQEPGEQGDNEQERALHGRSIHLRVASGPGESAPESG